MRKGIQITKTLVISLVFLGIMLSGNCNAQDMLDRGGRVEVFGLVQSMGGDTTESPDFEGLELELDDTVAGGFGLGFNLNEHFNLNFDMFFASLDMTGKYYYEEMTVDTDMIGMDFNLDFNLLKGSDSPVTPLLTAGIGFINFENDDLDISETDFSYNLGIGVRWEFLRNLFIKGIYRATWTELEDTDDQIMLDGVTLSIGYIF